MAERRCRRVSALETGMQCSDRYSGVWLMQLVVQYLTKAVVRLPSAGDNMHSSVQFNMRCNLLATVLGAPARECRRESS